MTGLRQRSGVHFCLVVACLMVVVEFSACDLLDQLALYNYRNPESKRDNNFCEDCRSNRSPGHANFCFIMCASGGTKRSPGSALIGQEVTQKRTPDLPAQSQTCLLDQYFKEIPEEGQNQVLQVLAAWM